MEQRGALSDVLTDPEKILEAIGCEMTLELLLVLRGEAAPTFVVIVSGDSRFVSRRNRDVDDVSVSCNWHHISPKESEQEVPAIGYP